MQLTIDLNIPGIQAKITNPKFGTFVSNEWKRLIDPYTPRDTGALMGITGQTVDIRPFAIHYKSKYSEAVYYNKRGVTFITQGTGRNPYATERWDLAAEKAGQKDKLYRTVNNALQSGRF